MYIRILLLFFIVQFLDSDIIKQSKMWHWYETMNIGIPLGFVSWKLGLQTMHMLQSLAAPKKEEIGYSYF